MSWESARLAKERVWDKWGAHIPAALADYEVEKIFKFHTEKPSYDIAFSSTYIRTFRKAGGYNCRSGDKFAGDVAAFVTAEKKIDDRMIHVSPSGIDHEPVALLAHEYLHFLSHPSFYPEYYSIGGNCPFQVEGITEWMMIECFPAGSRTIVYTGEYAKTAAWLGANAGNQARMLSFIFDGVATDLSSISP